MTTFCLPCQSCLYILHSPISHSLSPISYPQSLILSLHSLQLLRPHLSLCLSFCLSHPLSFSVRLSHPPPLSLCPSLCIMYCLLSLFFLILSISYRPSNKIRSQLLSINTTSSNGCTPGEVPQVLEARQVTPYPIFATSNNCFEIRSLQQIRVNPDSFNSNESDSSAYCVDLFQITQ